MRDVLGAYPSLEAVGEASNGEEALGCAGTLKPDVVLMDIHLHEPMDETHTDGPDEGRIAVYEFQEVQPHTT